MKIESLSDLVDHLNEEDNDHWLILSIDFGEGDLPELLETGSVTIEVDGKSYVLSLTLSPGP